MSSLAAPRKQCVRSRMLKQTQLTGRKNGTALPIKPYILIDYGYRLYNDILCKLRVQTNA